MAVLRALAAGLRRTLSQPALVLALWGINVAAALPATWLVATSIRESIDHRRVQDNLREGFDMEWYGIYEDAARGIEKSFTPAVLGAGAFFSNLEAWVTGEMFTRFPGLVVTAAVYLLVWALLLGGVLDRFVHPDSSHSRSRFLDAGGRFFFRFVRLALGSGVVYYGVYRLHRWIYGWLEEAARDVTVERTLLGYSLGVIGFTALLLVVVHLGFAYAKIATVVEDRRSMVLAALGGFRFVLSHPVKTLGLYFALALISAALVGLYHLTAPGAGQTTFVGVAIVFVAGQAVLIARLVLRLALLGGATELYRSHR